jgi:hypothetical protein
MRSIAAPHVRSCLTRHPQLRDWTLLPAAVNGIQAHNLHHIMIRFVLRFFGLVTLAAAFFFFVYDGARFIANQQLQFTTVGWVWTNVDQNSLQSLQPAVERHVAPWVWQLVLQPYVLEAPAWLLLLIIGAILVLLGRKKKPLIGYAR